MKPFLPTLLFSALVFSGATYAASMDSDTVMVGGAAMYPSKNIVENAVNSKDHTTLVAAVKAAGLVPTLEGKGPFTVLRRPMPPLQNCRRAPSTLCLSQRTNRSSPAF